MSGRAVLTGEDIPPIRMGVYKDNPPLNASFPTFYFVPRWLPGQTVADPFPLPVDPATPPGEYWLEVGLYSTESLRRVPVFNREGDLVTDRIIVGSVRVEE